MSKKTNELTVKDLVEYGFRPKNFGSYAFEKEIAPGDDELGQIMLVIATTSNKPEFALLLPEGQLLFLGVKNLDDLQVIENSIRRYEPKW